MRLTKLTALVALGLVADTAWAGETITYQYDALGRLVDVSHSGTANNGMKSSYTYDARDNRSNVTVTGSSNGSGRVIVLPLGGLFVMPIN